ncbi:RWD domain-containing protein 2A-like [Musca vetustissima]|uniref:RWD domain-containing protein 2A-like n=1 Tax=Musca vetustissima TaxID=27455 RepID=UPI002AB78DC3|nr:RWD domain-containing protein 2A-like [Musca vetustissima]
MDDQLEMYKECIAKQLEEVDMLSSIYCSPGEMHIFDPGVISDFNEFLENPTTENVMLCIKAHLDYSIKLQCGRPNEKLEVRIELPHMYPLLENAIVIVHTPLLTKNKEIYLKKELEIYIESMDKSETYIYQVLSWLQDNIDDLIQRKASDFEVMTTTTNQEDELLDFERLWIYSHHIKSKTKRQEIVKEARNLELTGFSRPGKPGIICVEGTKENTQEFWRTIRAYGWQKISLCKIESARKTKDKLDKLRRFEGFKEQLFCDDIENSDGVMNMALFLKYLENHNSGYMKKELFGLE